MEPPRREWSSFRDPGGFVFHANGVVYRQVNEHARADYQQLIESGLYSELARDGLLVSHEEVELERALEGCAYAVLRPQPIPFVSYPYEWCFSQYKAAAELTLEVQRRALNRGMILRDASSYNVQFLGHRPIFIDTLSFGSYEQGSPWVAYRQFCTHFLAPLSLMAHASPALGQLTRVHLDGIPLTLASTLLPMSSRLRAGILVHVHLHARSEGVPSRQQAAALVRKNGHLSKTALLGIVESLSRTVGSLHFRKKKSIWSDYVDETNYTPVARASKEQIVGDWIDRLHAEQPLKMVWDLGANTGTFSRLAGRLGSHVVSFDLDHAAVESNFQHCQAESTRTILPLIQDVTNPSPGLGWRNRERRSLQQRGPSELTLALALVHHLVIARGVPISAVAAFLHEISRYLILEFVPKEDSQIQRMLAFREDIFGDYSQVAFETAFNRYFRTVATAHVRESARILYLMESRSL